MDMQDKEFDELFRSKLGELEAGPSKRVWDNIAAEVVIDKKDRSALPFISIAASVLVLITAGLFFIPKLKQENAKPGVAVVVKQKDKPKPGVVPPKIEQAVISPQPLQVARVAVVPNTHRIKPIFKKQNSIQPAIKIEQQKNEQQVAQALVPKAVPQNDAVLAIVKPDFNEAPTTVTPIISNEVKVPEVNKLTAQQIPAKTVAAVQPKKRRISSFGDLINVVVSKVDKRKDKLIEFSNKDDDESLVTGINLGILRVKKEEVIATNK